MRLVDLSMPIAPHFRWRTQISITGDIKAGQTVRVRVTGVDIPKKRISLSMKDL